MVLVDDNFFVADKLATVSIAPSKVENENNMVEMLEALTVLGGISFNEDDVIDKSVVELIDEPGVVSYAELDLETELYMNDVVKIDTSFELTVVSSAQAKKISIKQVPSKYISNGDSYLQLQGNLVDGKQFDCSDYTDNLAFQYELISVPHNSLLGSY